MAATTAISRTSHRSLLRFSLRQWRSISSSLTSSPTPPSSHLTSSFFHQSLSSLNTVNLRDQEFMNLGIYGRFFCTPPSSSFSAAATATASTAQSSEVAKSSGAKNSDEKNSGDGGDNSQNSQQSGDAGKSVRGSKLAAAVDKIKEKSGIEIVPVFISVDPERDTVKQVKECVKGFYSVEIILHEPLIMGFRIGLGGSEILSSDPVFKGLVTGFFNTCSTRQAEDLN